MPEPEKELIQEIQRSGYSRLEIANRISLPYGTLSCKLNGFIPMDSDTRKAIKKVLSENKKNGHRTASVVTA